MLYIAVVVQTVTKRLVQQIIDVCWFRSSYACGRRRLVGFSCQYRYIVTTVAKMTVFICHCDYYCYFLASCLFIIFSLPTVCRQSFTYIHIQLHYMTLDCSDRKTCPYPAGIRTKYLGVQ
jgi:hypothetical protein